MTIFEKSEKGQKAWSLPKSHPDFERYQVEEKLRRRTPLPLPEVSELNLMRHFSELAKKNMGIDTNFYPLGSCTMKYNPRVQEAAASLSGFMRTHPLAPDESVQGNLQIMWELVEKLADITGFSAGTLVPNSGAQGEFCGIRMIQAYHQSRKDPREVILVPDNAHGTNPATAAMAGYKIISIRTDPEGDMDLEDLKKHLSSKIAGLMLTNPNTLGLFSPRILEITRLVHEAGGLLYYDGANLNPILMRVRPGDMGFDVMHLNLHKTFSTPHGGGGPGSGPVLCSKELAPFLPVPHVVREKDHFIRVEKTPLSIGPLATFNGNFAVCLRAYLYLQLHGKFGLRRLGEIATLNANYLKQALGSLFTVPFSQPCFHEFVVQADRFLDKDVKAQDIAKRLLDYGIHAPTVYFPLIIKECLLIEPTETESKATLDHFIDVLKRIIQEIEQDPTLVKTAPHTTPVGRLDEVAANRQPKLHTKPEN